MRAKPPRSRRHGVIAVALLLVALAVTAMLGPSRRLTPAGAATVPAQPAGIHLIKHIVVIMQENRSFDSYFGTYPGADGIPMQDGTPTVCVPDAYYPTCQRPYVTHADVEGAGPHGQFSANGDVDGGKMDGFVIQAEGARVACARAKEACSTGPIDVMGYHTESDIPNYWKYARRYVLQDHMFEPNASWSLPAHLFMVSGWSADCTSHKASSCTDDIDQFPAAKPIFAWTDMTYLMHKHKVSWGYYLTNGTEPDCRDPEDVDCAPVGQNSGTPSYWNPLPWFDTVRADQQTSNIQSVSRFFGQAKAGRLPAVSWVVPDGYVSEHPPSPISAGQTYVTSLVNAVMRSPNWSSTAVFVTWDDWGGFYDHVVPPTVDANGYGLRVPGFLISPYAKKGYIDHQTLSFDAFNKLIEDVFLGGQRLDPRTDGRPDPRPSVREKAAILGDLRKEFDFEQKPRPPMILPVDPKTTLTSIAPFEPRYVSASAGTGQATVRWTKPQSAGGARITAYRITPYLDGAAQPPITYESIATKQTLTSLTAGHAYAFTIAAINRNGVGLESPKTNAVTIK